MPFRRAPNCATGPFPLGGTLNNNTTLRGPTVTSPVRASEYCALTGRRPSWLGRLLRGGGGGRYRLATMRQRQPGREMARGLVRGTAVERHHRRRHPGQPAQLRTPSIGDERDLNVEGTAANGLLKAMNHSVCPD